MREWLRQNGRQAGGQEAPEAPGAVHRATSGVAAAKRQITAVVQRPEQVDDALGRMGEIGVHHHQSVESGQPDAVQD